MWSTFNIFTLISQSSYLELQYRSRVLCIAIWNHFIYLNQGHPASTLPHPAHLAFPSKQEKIKTTYVQCFMLSSYSQNVCLDLVKCNVQYRQNNDLRFTYEIVQQRSCYPGICLYLRGRLVMAVLEIPMLLETGLGRLVQFNALLTSIE